MAFLAGACFFLMVSFRIPCILHALAYVPLLWVAYREQGFRRALSLGVAFVGGFTSALAALILHAIFSSYFNPFLRMLARNFEYASGSQITFSESLHRAWETILGIIHANPAFPVLMAISILLLLPKPKKSDELRVMSDESELKNDDPLITSSPSLITDDCSRITNVWLWVGLLWLAAARASAFPGGRHFAHYYHVAWPPVCILSVLWLSSPRWLEFDDQFRRRVAWGMTVIFTATAVVLNGRGFMREASRPDSPRVAIRQAADYLNDIAPPNATVPVCVWGHWAELWWRVPRPSVTRCIAPQCFYVINREMFDEWVQAMIDRPPDLIVADASMIGPLSWNSPYDNTEFRPPPGHPLYHLRHLVDENYVEIRRIDDLSFLARRNGPNDPHGK
jgi:hypothetical protein